MSANNGMSPGRATRVIHAYSADHNDDSATNDRSAESATDEHSSEERVTVPKRETKKAMKAAKQRKKNHLRVARMRVVKDIHARQGFRGFVWGCVAWLFRLTGWGWLVVKPGRKDRIYRLAVGLMQDVERTQLTAITLNQKGGVGKTPVATAIGAMIAWVTQQFTLLVDVNQTKGNTASRIGVTKTQTLREAVHLFMKGTRTSYDTVRNDCGRHPSRDYGSLRVITSDNAAQRALLKLGYKSVFAFFEDVINSVHALIFDGGNTNSAHTNIDDAKADVDTDDEGVATRAAAHFAKVMMFVARPRLENSLTDCLDTMDHYRLTMPEKVDNGVIVIVGHRQLAWWKRWGGRQTKRDQVARDYYAKMFDVPSEHVALIPEDPFYEVEEFQEVEKPDDLIKIITADKLKLSTQEAYLSLCRLLYAIQRAANERELEAGATASKPDDSNQDSPQLAQVEQPVLENSV